MLRYAQVTLLNPAKPELPVMRVKAVVTDEDFGLCIGQRIAEQLQLEQIALREVEEVGEPSRRLVPYVGPVRIVFAGKEAFVGALSCGTGAVIGAQLARELQMLPDQTGENKSPFPVPVVNLLQKADAEASLSQLMITQQAIDSALCRKICDYAAAQLPARAGLVETRHKTSIDSQNFTNAAIRDTFRIDIDGIEGLLTQTFFELFTRHVEPFFGVEIESWEYPQILLYRTGGHYEIHSDADRWRPSPGEPGVWERYMDRDISVLLYLNNAFTGGKLNFPALKHKITPEPGLLVAFPSHASYRHGAEPTESGERLVIATWASVRGTPRVREKPDNRIFMYEMRPGAAQNPH